MPSERETPGEITLPLTSWRGGGSGCLRSALPPVLDELRVLARRQLRRVGREQALDTTALIHESYLKLVDQSRSVVQDRHHFFALAAKAMRHILVDEARRKGAGKRGGAMKPVTLDDGVPAVERAAEVIAVDEALARLEIVDPRLGKIVELRFLRRPVGRGNRGITRCVAAHREARLAEGARLPVSRAGSHGSVLSRARLSVVISVV